MGEMDEAVNEFIAECEEMIDRISLNFSALERDQSDPDIINSIYRDVHTMKGSSQLFGFQAIGYISHALEASLDPVRREGKSIDPLHGDIVLRSLDMIAKEIQNLKAGGASQLAKEDLYEVISKTVIIGLRSLGGTRHFVKDQIVPVHTVAFSDEELLALNNKRSRLPTKRSRALASSDGKADAESPNGGHKEENDQEFTGKTESDNSGSIRVQISVLDNLMGLAGELILVRNQIVQLADREKSRALLNLGQRVNTLTTDLQNEIMKTRMQPLSNLLSKLHVHAAKQANKLKKSAKLATKGAETEVDKSLLEHLFRPMLMVINFIVEYSIEHHHEREKRKKFMEGIIDVSCYQEGEQVVVEIADDGKGITTGDIFGATKDSPEFQYLQQSKDKTNILNQLFDPKVFNRVHPTLPSTDNEAADLPMAREIIESFGGSLQIYPPQQTTGTYFSIKIPMTLAIVPSLIVKSGTWHYAIPQVKLVELIRVDTSDSSSNHIKTLQGKKVLNLRGRLLPLVALTDILLRAAPAASDVYNIAVLRERGQDFGLIVDEIHDATEIVVKPLTSFLKHLDYFTGSTVLGDGAIALTLDTSNIAANATDLTRTKDKTEKITQDLRQGKDLFEYLIVDIGAETHYAIPLDRVGRLEEFSPKNIAYSGKQKVHQYRGELLPINSMSQLIGIHTIDNQSVAKAADGNLRVVVVKSNRTQTGLQVDEILDVVTRNDDISPAKNADKLQGIAGYFHHEGEVIPVIDTDKLMALAEAMYRIPHKSHQVTELENILKNRYRSPADFTLLCVEDSEFFRKQLAQFLQECQFKVVAAEHGKEGLDILRKGIHNVDLVITDIEMPIMNGLEFTETLRSSPTFSNLPIIAVTTRFRKKDVEKGLAAGVDHYLEKLNKAELLQHIYQCLNIQQKAA